MNVKYRFLVIMMPVLLCDIVLAQEIKVEEPPSWVEVVKHPKTSQVSKYDVKSGAYFTLIDFQAHLEKESTYYHQVQKIVSSGGVNNASKLQITYDTTYQNVVLHQVKVWRNDQLYDKSSQLKFEYVKNEQNLQSNIYSGYVTALAIIEDLRKNDILEVAYTVIGNNPVYDKANYQLLPLQDINPIDRVFVRAIYPSEGTYEYRCVGCGDGALEESQEGQNTVLTFDDENLEGVDLENTMATWIIPYNYLEISSTKSWDQVNKWALDIFEQDDDDRVDQVLAETFGKGYTLEEKINAAIDFVQDEIRYMGIESGMGNIKPFTPNQTLKQRFGDCKDKSLLLITMLRRIGVAESYVALVNSTMQHNVSTLIPSGQVFDHCIVYFKYQGKDYWIDPTYSFQGGSFKDIVTYDYGKALIVSDGTVGLSEMNTQNSVSKTVIQEHFDISSFDTTATINIKAKMFGAKSDLVRQVLEYYSKKELAEAFKYPLGLLYPTLVETQKLMIRDDEIKNILETEENYSVTGAWKESTTGFGGNKMIFDYEPTGLGNYIYNINCEPRNFPVLVEYPVDFQQSTVFELPQIMFIDTAIVRYDNDAFTYEKTTKLLGIKTIEHHYSFVTKTKEISPDSFMKVCHDMNEIMNTIRTIFEFPKPGSTGNNVGLNFFNSNSFKFNKNLNGTNSSDAGNSQFLYKPDELLVSAPATNDNGENVKVDQQPSYPGGMGAFYKYIGKHLKYPKQAKRMKLSGRVYVSFVISRNGELQSVKAVKGIGAGCDEEAERLVQAAGKWNPGKANGEPVEVKMILPVTFKL